MDVHRTLICSLVVVFAGATCNDVGPLPQPWSPQEQPQEIPVAKPSVDRPPSVVVQDGPVVEAPVLRLPQPTGCEEPAMIGSPDVDNDVARRPIVEETYGADGCVDERWIREWDGDQPIHEFYDFFDDSVGQNSYVMPFRYSKRWIYDEQGRVVRLTQAGDVGTEPDHVVRQRWEDGKLVEKVVRGNAWQQDGGGQAERRQTWRYDAGGRLLEHVMYHDGAINRSERNEFDHSGKLLETWKRVRDTEWLALENEYDDRGYLVFQHTAEVVGTETATTEFVRDEEGTLREKIEDHHSNGWRNVWHYDAQEREVLYTQDDDLDGVVDYRQERAYDSEGNEVLERVEYDGRRREVRREFDARGRPVEKVAEPAWHEGPTIRTTWDYDDGAGRYSVTVVYRRDGVRRTRSVHRYSDDDRLIWSRVDGDGDGELEQVVRQSWEDGRLTERVTDQDGDGVADRVVRHLHDRLGQQVEMRLDSDGDGRVDERRAWSRRPLNPTR